MPQSSRTQPKPSLFKQLGNVIKDYALDWLGDKKDKTVRQSKPAIERTQLEKLTQRGRVRAERPTRDRDWFFYIMDVEANMPSVSQALTSMSEDVAHDERGDERAWSINATVEPLDDSPESRQVARDLRQVIQQIGDDFADRTGIGYFTKHYVREFLSTGNCFAEQWISLDNETGFGQVERIKQLPTWQIRPIWDDLGDLVAYEQWTVDNDNYPIRWNIPQQVIHWKYRGKQYTQYGMSVLEPLMGAWERFKLIELDYVMAIHTRSVAPMIVSVGDETAPITDIEDGELKKVERKLRENPADINRYYVVAAGYQEITFPNTGDADAITVLAKERRELENDFVQAIGHTGKIGSDTGTRRAASSIDQKYARKINSLRSDFSHFLYPAVFLEFALKGYNFKMPEKYGVKRMSLKISWPDLGETPSQKTKRVLLEWSTGAIPLAVAHQQLGYQDSEGMIEQMKAEREAGVLPLSELFARRTQPVISNNGEEGPGVPTRDNGDENQPQATASRDRNALRALIREELRSIAQETNMEHTTIKSKEELESTLESALVSASVYETLMVRLFDQLTTTFRQYSDQLRQCQEVFSVADDCLSEEQVRELYEKYKDRLSKAGGFMHMYVPPGTSYWDFLIEKSCETAIVEEMDNTDSTGFFLLFLDRVRRDDDHCENN